MDMLLASSVILSKIINSTFGNGKIKGFDESVVDKIYDEFKSHARIVASDKVLLYYPEDKWLYTESTTSNETTKAFRFNHPGNVNVKMTIENYSVGSQYMITRMDSTGFILDGVQTEPVEEVLMYGEMILPLEITVPFSISNDRDFKIRIDVIESGSTGTRVDNLDLRICGEGAFVDVQRT